MKDSTKISIILPVYNGEKTIKRCINSVLNQNYSNYELIIIDDGSDDKTSTILNEYCHIKTIKVLNKNNGGVSSARNLGLQYVSGDYLMFLDSDDYILEGSLFCLSQVISSYCEADVIIYGWKEESLDILKTVKHVDSSVFIKTDECIKSILTTDQEYGGGYPWNKLWKVENLKNNGEIIEFNETLILCEDKEWTIRALLRQKNILLSNLVIYNYMNLDGEHLSAIDFDLVERKNNNKIISFLNASVIICKLLDNGEYTLYELAKLLRNRDIIMIMFKSIKNKNKEIYDYTYRYYSKFVKGKLGKYNIKTLIMLICIILYEMKIDIGKPMQEE